jgi:hypothetical protein
MRDNIKMNHRKIEQRGEGGWILFRIFEASQASWDISGVELSGSVFIFSVRFIAWLDTWWH